MTQPTYNSVTDAVVDELRRIVGEAYVVYGDADKLEPYSHDEVPDRHYAHMPDVLVRPRTAKDIAAVMKLANRETIPVTPRGAGSGLSGGAVPIHGGIVLLCDRMNEILEVDTDNMMIVAEPGVVTAEINERLEGTGLFYAGYPMSLETCYLAGNVAENAGGGKAVKYGVTSRYVLGLEVVTPQGEIVQLGGKLIKDVTGYNLVQLMLGSEGTLGIFTKIIIKLTPAPRSSVDLLALFKTAEDAISTVPKIMTESGIVPTAIEFIDRNAVKLACDYLNETLPYQDAGAMLLLTCDGADAEQVEREYEAIGEQCLATGAMEVYVADNHTTTERIWSVRRNIAEAAGLMGPYQANEDLTVPPAAIPALVMGLDAIGKKYGVFMLSYGHAGDGNIHSRIIKQDAMTIEQWNAKLPDLLHEVYEMASGLGGQLSGEHGIGHKRKKYIGQFLSEQYLDLCRALKKAWDPNLVLNPGKIFDV